MGQKLVSPATYWRRRVVVLAVGVAVLALPIWAVNQALGGSHAPGQGSARAHAGQVTGPSARPPARRGQAPTRATADLGSRPRARLLAIPRDASTSPSPRARRQACAGAAVQLTLRS